MSKETAIMELMIASQQYEAVTAAIRALGNWVGFEDVKEKLRKKKKGLAKKMNKLSKIVNGGEIDMDKV